MYSSNRTENRTRNRTLGPQGYAVVLLIAVAAVELVVGRTHLVWKLVPESDIGNLLTMEDVLVRRNPPPEVVFFGSSRGREAFLPACMEQEMGLPKGKVLSLAMGGVNILDALVAYERNRSLLSHARIVVLQVDPFQLSAGQYPPPPRFREFATWSDRFAYHGRGRVRLLADYVFGMDKALPAVSLYVKYWLKYRRPPNRQFERDELGRFVPARAAMVPVKHLKENYVTEKWHRYWLAWAYPDYEYSEIMEGQLESIVRMAKAGGAEVYVVYIPTSGNYLDLLLKEPGDPYNQFRARLERLAAKTGFHIGWWESPADAGLSDRDFVDWGHLNPAGARKWTIHFTRWLNSANRKRATSQHAGLVRPPHSNEHTSR